MLKGKNAIITGTNRGIGRATVEVFAQNGANIWACARKCSSEFEEDMARIAKKYEVSIWPIYFDMTDEEQMLQEIKEIRKERRSIDVLVNNAGVADEASSFAMTAMEKMRHVFDVNFFGVTRLTQYVARLMIRQKGGSIVNIASIAGLDGTPAQYEYVGSKAAIVGATKELARELGPYGIRVNAVAPGITDTNMGAQMSDELLEKTLGNVIMKRLGKPEEIANVIAFLASDNASFVTAQTIRVDGGM